MRPKRFSVSENVIHVDFGQAHQDQAPNAAGNFPRRVNIEFGEKAYTAASTEEELTGMNKSTITNRAVQVYHKIMEKQRAGQPLGFLDPKTEMVDLFHIDDPRKNDA